MALKESIIDQIRGEHSRAPRGEKSSVVRRWADILKCSKNSIWSEIKTSRKRTKVSKNEALEETTKIVFQVKYRGPACAPPLPTDQAYDLAVRNGLFLEGMPLFSVSSINRQARKMGLSKETHRVQRYQAERPNQMHHVDASTSKFFYADRKTADGKDFVLKTHGPSQNYKNKPTPLHQRVWIYGLTDDYSGLAVARYIVAPGEELSDNIQFLEWAWSQTDDKVFCGIPEMIKGDKGPMMRGKAAEDWFDRLGVDIDPTEPGAKDSHGKIERPWRTHFGRFERQLLAVDDWKKFEITLSELNRRFLIYLNKEYNQRQHRNEKGITREQAWKRIQLSWGIKPLPEGAFGDACKSIKRKVLKDGTFSLDGKTYEVKGNLFDAWANIIVNIFTGEMIAQSIETGEKYEIIDFKPTPVGEFKSHKETPHQKIKKMSVDLSINKTLFEEDTQQTNVRTMPIKMQGETPFNRVFNIGAFNSVKAAMDEFQMLTMTFPEAGSEDRAELEQLFINNGLSKEFVKKTAHDFINYREKESRRYGNV